MEANKWEVKSHSRVIGCTGDYDGYHELTNGQISLSTKDDEDDTVEIMEDIADKLNQSGIRFYDDAAEAAKLDHYLSDQGWQEKLHLLQQEYDKLKGENELLKANLNDALNMLKDARALLLKSQEKAENYQKALKDIAKQEKSDEWECEGDIYDGYDCIIGVARTALSSYNSQTNNEKEA